MSYARVNSICRALYVAHRDYEIIVPRDEEAEKEKRASERKVRRVIPSAESFRRCRAKKLAAKWERSRLV